MLFSVICITENDNNIRSKDTDVQRFLNICKALPVELNMLISFLAYKNTKEKFIKNETLLKLCINYFLNGE
jgi:DNA-binding Xre family transcriptional regulator